MLNSRQLRDLRPEVMQKAVQFINACHVHGIAILVTSTYRDNESQQALYNQGRTTPGKIVTNAKPGESFHNYGVAFDFVPLVNGKALWDDVALFVRCGELAESCGLEWAGRWKSFKELAHCQFTGGKSIAQLKKEMVK